MFSPVQIAQPVEAFDHHGESDQQPNDQDAVGLVVTDMLHAIAVFAIVEAAILNLPAALGPAIETQATQRGDGEVGDPLGLDDRAIHDATQVIAYFNYINRVADALGVEPETFVQKWG